MLCETPWLSLGLFRVTTAVFLVHTPSFLFLQKPNSLIRENQTFTIF